MPPTKRTAFDCPHVQSVAVFALIHPDLPGKIAGRIVANYSDNPNGSVCTATVHIFAGPLAIIPTCTGRAGGYGYDKLSSAVCSALHKAITEGIASDGPTEALRTLPHPTFNGAGMSGAREWFEPYGYTLHALLGN